MSKTSTDIEMITIPPGTFWMGSPEDEEGRWGDEGPQHEVTIKTEFLMSRYPITQAQWAAIRGFAAPLFAPTTTPSSAPTVSVFVLSAPQKNPLLRKP